MAITQIQQKQSGPATVVTVVSDATPPVYFHWYLDGEYVGMTSAGVRSFLLPPGSQARVDVVDTTDAAFDPLAAPPAAYPAHRTIYWIQSAATDMDHYRVEESEGIGGPWVVLGRVPHADDRWEYFFRVGPVTDSEWYTWRVIPVDTNGTDGTTIDPGTIKQQYHRPPAPDFTVAFNAGPTTVTIAAA